MLSYLFGQPNQDGLIEYVRSRIKKRKFYEEIVIKMTSSVPYFVSEIVSSNLIWNTLKIRSMDVYVVGKDGYYKKFDTMSSGDTWYSIDFGHCLRVTEYKILQLLSKDTRSPCDSTQVQVKLFKQRHQELCATFNEFTEATFSIKFIDFYKSLPQAKPSIDAKAPIVTYDIRANLTLEEVSKILLSHDRVSDIVKNFYSAPIDMHSYYINMDTVKIDYNLHDSEKFSLRIVVNFKFLTYDAVCQLANLQPLAEVKGEILSLSVPITDEWKDDESWQEF